MVGFPQDRLGVVQVVVVACVDDGIVSVKKVELIPPVKVDAVDVEEDTVCEEHDVHVDGADCREEK